MTKGRKQPKKALDVWTDEALALPPDQVTVRQPIAVLAGEAVDVAKFLVKYWDVVRDPVSKVVVRPGMEMAARRIPSTTSSDLISLSEALQQAHTAYLLTSGSGPTDVMDRARYVVSETKAALEYLFDDGVEDDSDAQLAAIGKAHAADPDTADALALELADYAELASRHRDELVEQCWFDAAFIDEALQLARALREKPATPQAGAPVEQKKALDLRNRIATLLWQRMSQVRAAARYVFRHHPMIVREVTSAYDRRRRAAWRRERLLRETGHTGSEAPA